MARGGRARTAMIAMPVDVATQKPPKPRPMTPRTPRELLDQLEPLGDPTGEAVRDLIESRR